MSTSPRQIGVAQSSDENVLFTIGNHPLGHAPRQWERAASAPRKRPQRKGTKVWRRQASQNQDAAASAQLMADLEASLETHTSKRQRTLQVPPEQVAKQRETYAPTKSDTATPARKRKSVTRRKSTRSPVKQSLSKHMVEDGWLSPTEKAARRRSSIKPLNSQAGFEPTSRAGMTTEEQEEKGDNTQQISFLEAIDLQGSTMFDKEAFDTRDEDTEATSETEGIFEEGQDIQTEDTSQNGDSHAVTEDDQESDSDDFDECESTNRLIDAGNTGVVELNLAEDDSDLEDLTSNQSLSEDFGATATQEQVAGLLEAIPTKEETQPDEHVATPSPATGEDRTRPAEDFFRQSESPATPTLEREDTGSTIPFEDLDVTGLVFGTGNSFELAMEESIGGKNVQFRELPVPVLTERQAQLTANEPAVNDDAEATNLNVNEDEKADDSADELFAGSPTLKRIFLSPPKVKPLSPEKLSPQKTRSGPRLSDDTTYLNDFLFRVRSQAAARSQDAVPSPVKVSTPQKSPRRILGELSVNSPSPSPAGKRRLSPVKEGKSRRSEQDATGSPMQMPKTPIARVLLSNSLDSPETPDELSAMPSSSTATTSTGDGSSSTRRGGRLRLPPASRLPMTAPSNIPLRRADGEPPVLQRTEAQKVARTTAANTRRNKGGARFPRQVIESLEGRQLSPMKNKGVVKNRKGQNVDWDHRLVYFLEDTGTEVEIDDEGKLVEKANGKEVKRKVRIIKGERVADGEEAAEQQLGELPNEIKPEPVQEAVTDEQSNKITKGPRRVKVAVPKTSRGKTPATSSKNEAATETRLPTTKPRQTVRSASTSLNVKGTPAAKRMLSIEPATPSMPAAKRRVRRA